MEISFQYFSCPPRSRVDLLKDICDFCFELLMQKQYLVWPEHASCNIGWPFGVLWFVEEILTAGKYCFHGVFWLKDRTWLVPHWALCCNCKPWLNSACLAKKARREQCYYSNCEISHFYMWCHVRDYEVTRRNKAVLIIDILWSLSAISSAATGAWLGRLWTLNQHCLSFTLQSKPPPHI